MSTPSTSDIRAIAATVAHILRIPVPAGAEAGPIAAVVESLPKAERLALVVIDGFGSSQWDRMRRAIPTLDRLAGLNRVDLGSVVPTLTYVCLSSMLTGVSPGGHGVMDRSQMVAAVADGRIETLFGSVRGGGGKTLLAVHRKGVEGLPLDRLADQSIVVGGLRDDGIYARVPAALPSGRPAFVVLHLIEIDEAGHAWGPGSAEARRIASETDRRLAPILGYLADAGYAVLVTADHGMHETGEDVDGQRGTHDGSVEEDLRVPLVWASAEQLKRVLCSGQGGPDVGT